MSDRIRPGRIAMVANGQKGQTFRQARERLDQLACRPPCDSGLGFSGERLASTFQVGRAGDERLTDQDRGPNLVIQPRNKPGR